MAVGLFQEDGLPRHVVAHLPVDWVALAHAGERREAEHGEGGVRRRDVAADVELRVVAVGVVELRDGLKLASVAHAVDERPEDVLLPPLALCVLPLVVPGAGVQQEV